MSNKTIAEFLEHHKQFSQFRPASSEEAGLFYLELDETADERLGTVGHVRMDFGSSGKGFHHSWWPHNGDRFNTDEFKGELQEVVDMLRADGPLKDLALMRAFCYRNDGGITQDGRCFGYIVETEHYRYCLRCTPSPGDYQGYLYCYDLRQQQMAQQNRPVGRVTFTNGEQMEYLDGETYLTAIREELPYRTAKTVLQDVYALDEEHAEAVRVLEQLWVEGYTVAAHQLGKFYRDDLSTMRDHEKAERWFRLSAEAGNDFSAYALGKLLLSQKRTDEAVRWLDKAAGHGNPFAQYRLGKLCLTGESVKKDVRKALEYLTAAARQGNPFAQYTLGKLYLLGRDVEQDREQARDWFTRSAAQGNAYAQFFLDRFDQFRDPSVMLAATKLLHHMSRIFRDNSMPPRNPAGIRIDSKRRKRLTEKRMAMGHKADDHEEQVSYQQTM